MNYEVTLEYSDAHGRPQPPLRYTIVIALLIGLMNVVEYGVHDAAKALRETDKKLRKWTEAGRRVEVSCATRISSAVASLATRGGKTTRRRMTGRLEHPAAQRPPCGELRNGLPPESFMSDDSLDGHGRQSVSLRVRRAHSRTCRSPGWPSWRRPCPRGSCECPRDC